MCSATKILALLGHQVDYSLSPFIHNTAIAHLGLNYFYTIFNIASSNDLKEVFNGMRAMGIAGFNVTIPYKEKVIAHLDQLSPAATEIQAVNTIVNREGHLIGYNTDSYGFSEPLMPYREDIKGQSVAIFGNGGAARAAIHAFRTYFEPCCIHIVSRNLQRGERLRQDMLRQSSIIDISAHQYDGPDTLKMLKNCKLIINATPIGTNKFSKSQSIKESQEIIPNEANIWLNKHIAYDLVYNPFETPFLKRAKAKGATTINGLGMLIAQASQSFNLWTGFEMPLFNVQSAIMKRLEHNLLQ